MDLPGLGSMSGDDIQGEFGTVELSPGSEWRFEVPFTSQLVVKLIDGNAEIFGTELAVGAESTFVGQNSAIYTWQGCKFQWKGKDVNEYVSDETPMTTYANLHFALETLRRKHQQSAATAKPPSVLVLGSEDSGKTTLCKILVSYANKADRFPMLVNLDPREGVFSVPGGASAAPISDILDIEDGWGLSQTSGPTILHPKSPLVYFYGLENCATNFKYYKHVSSRLALGVAERLSADPIVKNSGVVIDTSGGMFMDKDQGYSLIESIVADYEVNVIIIIAQERLYSDMRKRFKDKLSDKSLQIVKVPKSGGCVEREPAFIRAAQSRSIREYFYGTLKQPLAPMTITVDYSLVTVYRIAEGKAYDGLLPGFEPDGESIRQNKIERTSAPSGDELLVKLETSAILQNCVMAMLNANIDDSPDVLVDSEVLGYVHVVDADDTKNKLKILMAVPGRLPSRPFLIGEYRYHE